MSFQRPQFLTTISWILVSKNLYLVFLTMLLKFFQSSTHFEAWYLTSLLLHSLFYHNLECFVILMIFEFLNQILSILSVNLFMIYLRTSLLVMWAIFSPLIASISLAMKFFSSLLFLMIVYFLVWMYSLTIAMLTVSRAYSDKSFHSK